LSEEVRYHRVERILITGATSFLGVHTVSKLNEGGIIPHLIVRPGSDLCRLKDIGDVELHQYDGEISTLVNAVEAAMADVCIHIAGAYVRDHLSADIEVLIESNIRFGGQLLEAMKIGETRRLVHAGSAFQYYESDTYRPLNFYAATKQAFMDLAAYYADAEGFDVVSIILPDVYGSRDWRPKILNRIIAAHVGRSTLDMVDEPTVLGLVHVDDASSALIEAASQLISAPKSVAGGIFGVDQGHRHSLRDIVEMVADICECSTKINWGGYPAPRRHISDPWEGATLPGWHPKVNLEDGIRELVECIRRERCE
jgi:nucleoside-diphosphate-sugar epimerase